MSKPNHLRFVTVTSTVDSNSTSLDDAEKNDMKNVGIKYDLEKPDYSLMPSLPLEDVVKILTLGAQKYDRDNWKFLENANRRYFAAAMRHMWARFRGEIFDPESGIDHCAHAICCMLFMMQIYRDENTQ